MISDKLQKNDSAQLQKNNSHDFALLRKLNKYSQGKYLIYIISVLENIDDFDCLHALSKTCKYFHENLKKRKSFRKLLQSKEQTLSCYKGLIPSVFENWQKVENLFQIVFKSPSLEPKKWIKRYLCEKALYKRGVTKVFVTDGDEVIPLIVFKTIVRNPDGSVKLKDQLEILKFFTASNDLDFWKYSSKGENNPWTYSLDKNHIYISIDEYLTSRIRNLLNHLSVGEIQYNKESKSYEESDTKTTINGKSIVELHKDLPDRHSLL